MAEWGTLPLQFPFLSSPFLPFPRDKGRGLTKTLRWVANGKSFYTLPEQTNSQSTMTHRFFHHQEDFR